MTNIKLAELDFDAIKQSIITYMKDHPDKTFNTYDFEGSGLNTIIDLLAYNTHHQAFYLNMVANEMFLDTAKIRENLVSKGKLLGYIPKSNKSTTIKVDLEFKINTNSEKVGVHLPITMDDRFYVNFSGKKVSFLPKNIQHAIRNNNPTKVGSNSYYLYKINGLELIQGERVKEEFLIDIDDPNQRLILSNPNIDTNTIEVSVSPSIDSNTAEIYVLESDNMTLSSESKVYFLQETHKELYEIYFGDNILGKQLETGSIVTVTYVICEGNITNGISDTDMTWIKGNNDFPVNRELVNIKIIDKSFGGSNKDTIDDIRHSAPRVFSTQSRAVTMEDYRTILYQIYPEIDSINVWGGETNDPPLFGKVLVAIKPKNGLYLSDFDRNNIKLKLRQNHSILGITPIIINPTYIKLKVTTLVKYESDSTIMSSSQIQDKVTTSIINYSDKILNSFGDYFKYSRFVSLIDDTDFSISNNITRVNVVVSYIIQPSSFTYVFDFSNKIRPGTIKSNEFKLIGDDRLYTLTDDENGGLVISTTDENGTYINNFVNGTVDYNKGKVIIDNVTIFEGESSNINVECVLQSLDIYPKQNQVLFVDSSTLDVTVVDNNIFYDDDFESIKVKIIR